MNYFASLALFMRRRRGRRGNKITDVFNFRGGCLRDLRLYQSFFTKRDFVGILGCTEALTSFKNIFTTSKIGHRVK